MFIILKPLRMIVRALADQSTPRQLSFGLALGILAGLVPKGNLLAVVLAMMLAASRVNLGVAGAAVLLSTFLSPLFDPFSHRIGLFLLDHPDLQSTWTWLYSQPLAPWTAFNNSVVLGSFVLGLLLLYPTHRLSRPLFERYSATVGQWARKFWLTRALLGAEWASRVGVVE